MSFVLKKNSHSFNCIATVVKQKHVKMEQESFEVEKIISKRFKRGVWEYRLKWLNFPSKYNSWEPATNLTCPDLLNEFEIRNVISVIGKFIKCT